MTLSSGRLLGLVALLIPGIAVASGPQDSYAGDHVSTYLRFLDPPAHGHGIATIPHLYMSFDGTTRAAVMDTGSTGIVVSAAAIPNIAALPTLGAARLTYSSSGRIMEGNWVVTPVTIAGSHGASITTSPIAVLAVTRIACLSTARNCTPEERPGHVERLELAAVDGDDGLGEQVRAMAQRDELAACRRDRCRAAVDAVSTRRRGA